MPPKVIGRSIGEGIGERARTTLSVLLFLLMILPSALVLAPDASSDPGWVDNGDYTESVLWNFTDAADYILVNSTVSGGTAKLMSVNETIVENTTAQYALGTATNIDNQTVQDAMVLNDTSQTVQRVALQPGPEGFDIFIEEWFPNYNPDTEDLTISGNYDPDPFSSKRCRILMYWDLTSIPENATILDASLWLYEKSSKAALLYYSIHALNHSFNEQTVTWNGGGGPAVGGEFSVESFANGTIDGSTGWHQFDLTRLVDLWVRKATPNYGFIIVSPDVSLDDSKNFVTSDETNKVEHRPILAVNYTVGEAVGVYASKPVGPGTNATFTLANWTESTYSYASDEFDSGLSSAWQWANNPSLSGGSVNFDTPGWLNVTGSQSTRLIGTSPGCNFLYQDIKGNFSASTKVQAYFSAAGMGAGLLMKSDALSWLALYMTGVEGSVQLVARVYNGAMSATLNSTSWASTSAYLRMIRLNNTYQLLASSNGNSWTYLANYTPLYDFTLTVKAGICVFSGGLAANPIAEFDFLRILPDKRGTTLELRARTGNSTLLTDPSWKPWGAPVSPSSGACLGLTGMYLQYQITLKSAWEWLSPMFFGFTCHDEHYLHNGTVTTMSIYPTDLKTWDSMTVTHSVANATVVYYYSSDAGSSWTLLGSGASFALGTSLPSMTVLAVLATQDTLSTPRIDSIELRYSKSITSFAVTVPASATAGQEFPITVEARDPSGNLATGWNGTVTLHALNAAGTGDASVELYVTQAYVPLGGTLTLWTQRYDKAETIRISASAGTARGTSAQLPVIAGPIASLTLAPANTTILEYDRVTFTATALDSFGNPITSSPIAWTADPALGTLNNTQGTVVILTAGVHGSGGYLNVSCSGMTVSRWVDVIQERFAPTFTAPLPNQVKDEDSGEWVLDISGYVSDVEDPDSNLSWYCANESLVELSGQNRTGDLHIVLSTIENLAGSQNITIYVVDSDGMKASTTVLVVIQPVNDPPKIDPVDPLVVQFGVPYLFDFTHYISDPDNSLSELSLSVDQDDVAYTTIDSPYIVFNYPESFVGTTRTVAVTVQDPEGASDATAIVVKISKDQAPIQNRMLPDVDIDQGETIEDVAYLPDHFLDPDGDALIFSVTCEHSTIRVKADGHINVTAPENWYGVEYAIVKAVDPFGARVEGIMQITVRQVNHPPVFEGVPDLKVHYDLPYLFDVAPYVRDLDSFDEEFTFSSSDSHCTFTGSMMRVLYPFSMNNIVNTVTITVSDGTQSDACVIRITVSADTPPELVPGMVLPDHSFQEDIPTSYPVGSTLEDYFTDLEDGNMLTFMAFSLDSNVTANAVDNGMFSWTVDFETTPNYYGTSMLVIRAIDSEGAIVERSVTLDVESVPDTPILSLPSSFDVTEGEHSLLNLALYISDPDSSLEAGDFTFQVTIVGGTEEDNEACLDCISILPGMIAFQFPQGFIDGKKTMTYELEVRATDQDGKFATNTMTLTIHKVPKEQNTLFVVGMIAAAGVAAGMFVVAVSMRKKPFVIHDMMIIHNDGFLIGRYAGHSHIEGEIDQDILSGMLTAVLNFVEDSMQTNQDQLKTFGFKEFQVLVKRGTRSFTAIVFEGDLPEAIDKPLGDFVGTFEKVYKNKIMDWSGDIETDFAGVEVLIQSFVKQNSKRRGKRAQQLWVSKKQRENGGATAK